MRIFYILETKIDMKARKIRTIPSVQDWLINIEARDPWRWKWALARQIRIRYIVRAQYNHHSNEHYW